MTKREYYDENHYFYCSNCNRQLEKKCFTYRNVHTNNHCKCRYCEWVERNRFPIVDGFNKYQIQSMLEFLLFGKSIYINDIADSLNIEVIDAIRLFRALNIGNKKCVVKACCSYCGKEIVKQMNVYDNQKDLYCSKECYWKDKPNKVGKGKDNEQYNRIKTNCTNCGKEIEVIPYDYNKVNKFGDNHNFCSQECYWEYRSKYYHGEKSVMYNYQYTDEQLEKMKINMINNARSHDRFNSKIQIKINDILNKLNVPYEREHVIKYYAIDNYLIDYNLIIEVMGDYWHVSPLKYNDNKYRINATQQKGLQHDKQKHTYIKNHLNIEILYLWESDIDNNIHLCEMLIDKYIQSNGILDNYHSFNWHIDEHGLLVLNKNLIIPYQDMHSNEYSHLIDKIS